MTWNPPPKIGRALHEVLSAAVKVCGKGNSASPGRPRTQYLDPRTIAKDRLRDALWTLKQAIAEEEKNTK